MRATSRPLAAGLLSLLLLPLAGPALATEEPATTTTETTAVADDGATQDVAPPAVTIPPPSGEQGTEDWTYRYLIPTLLALAAVVVIVTTVQYFLQVVRKRYKVVE